MYLGDGDSGCLGHGDIEVLCRFPEDKVSSSVGLPGLDQRKVSSYGLLEDVVPIAKLTMLMCTWYKCVHIANNIHLHM